MSLAVGLDVSELRMGWAVVGYDYQEPLALGVENLRKPDAGWPEEQVILAVRNVLGVVKGLGHDREEVFAVGLEDAYHGPSIKGTIRQAGVIGMATVAAQMIFGSHVTCWPIGNGTWLALLGIKPASRKRADVKAATMEWAADRLDSWGFDASRQLVGEDESDALGIATACALLTEKREAA